MKRPSYVFSTSHAWFKLSHRPPCHAEKSRVCTFPAYRLLCALSGVLSNGSRDPQCTQQLGSSRTPQKADHSSLSRRGDCTSTVMLSGRFSRLVARASQLPHQRAPHTTRIGLRTSQWPSTTRNLGVQRGVRLNSTQASGGGSTRTNRVLGFLETGIAVAIGIGLYHYFPLFSSESQDVQASQTFHTSSGLNEKYGTPADFQKAINELRAAFPDSNAVSTDTDDLHQHGFSGNDYHPGMTIVESKLRSSWCSPGSSPTVVVYPTSTEDVVKIVNISRKYRMPVVPYSGATSLEGQYRAVRCSNQQDMHVY